MNGIEILSTAEVATKFAGNETAMRATACLFAGITMIIGIFVCIHEHQFDILVMFFILAAMLAAVGAALAYIATEEPIAFETQYKVTVSDEVSMNEFNEKYEIISQEGKIYTVRERQEKTNE